jgi:hypothetical protein
MSEPTATPPHAPTALAAPWARRIAAAVAAATALLLLAGLVAVAALDAAGAGAVDPRARGTGHDAEWLGHAWVDGRKKQPDVDALAALLRGTGVRDLYVHAGPYADDGSLDPGLRPRARWLTGALHRALPGVRVHAWLGAHPGEIDLRSPATRRRLLVSVGQILDDGFDGIHEDFEPVEDGDPHLPAVLRETHRLTRSRHALLSVSATHPEPWPGWGRALRFTHGSLTLWSAGYLRAVATEADQVAVMAYDTALWTRASYTGYVRRVTAMSLSAVPPGVGLLIGVPAYADEHLTHHRRAETVPAALRGIRLALDGPPPAGREFGVALYVDFTATAGDWAAYRRDWA